MTAGTVLVPCSLISFAGLTLPLLVPAVMLLVTGARRSDARSDRPCAPVAVTTLVVLRAGGRGGLALIAHDDPRTCDPTSSGGTSDVVTVAESLLYLGLLSLAAVAAWCWPVRWRLADRRSAGLDLMHPQLSPPMLRAAGLTMTYPARPPPSPG